MSFAAATRQAASGKAQMPMIGIQSAALAQPVQLPKRPRTVRISAPLHLCMLAGLLVLGGCQAAEEQMSPCQGKVTYKGTPLSGGTIVFIPDSSRGTRGSIAVGQIQPDGTFTLKTNDALGAVPGHHRVTIAYQASYGASAASWRLALPARYRDPHLSGLAREVLPGTANHLNFDLD